LQRGKFLPASDRHNPFSTPADLAGTDRTSPMPGFFQDFQQIFSNFIWVLIFACLSRETGAA
jgi:hypothetical protein